MGLNIHGRQSTEAINRSASQIANRQQRGRPAQKKHPTKTKPRGSKSQTKLAKYCKSVLIGSPAYRQEMTWPWMKNTKGNNTYVDIVFPSINLAIEYDGPQHTKLTRYTPTKESLSALQARDKLKIKLLKAHGYKVIVWPYTRCISFKAVHSVLANAGFKVSIPPRCKTKSKKKTARRKNIRHLKPIKRRL